MKKVITIVLLMILCCFVTSCGNKNSLKSANDVASVESMGTLEASIESHEIILDANEASTILLNFKFKNNMKTDMNFKFNILVTVKQKDTILNPAVMPEDSKYNFEAALDKIPAGEEAVINTAYVLSDLETPVVVTIQPTSGDVQEKKSVQIEIAKKDK